MNKDNFQAHGVQKYHVIISKLNAVNKYSFKGMLIKQFFLS